MSQLKLESANVVLLEENGTIRRLVQSTLLGIGFGSVNECATVDAARRIIASTDPDLLILDLDRDGENVCAVINDVRHARVGDNPFVTIIGLTHHPAESVIQKVLDAGTDDLIRKPISTTLLTERITNLIRNRKDFVATSDYVGPQRSKGFRPETEDAAKVEVPNLLRDKANGKRTPDENGMIDDDAIRRAAEAFNVQRLSGLVLLIISQAAKLGQAIDNGARGAGVIGDVVKLSHLTSEASGIRLSESANDLAQLTASMARVMVGIVDSPAPASRQVEVLRLHAQAIAAATRGDQTAANKVVSAFNEVSGGGLEGFTSD